VRLLATLLYAANVTTAYLLMLAVMTYNVGYLLVVVAGLAAGHHLFAQPGQTTASDVCCVQPEDATLGE
jgi:Ctr copper transporter family